MWMECSLFSLAFTYVICFNPWQQPFFSIICNNHFISVIINMCIIHSFILCLLTFLIAAVNLASLPNIDTLGYSTRRLTSLLTPKYEPHKILLILLNMTHFGAYSRQQSQPTQRFFQIGPGHSITSCRKEAAVHSWDNGFLGTDQNSWVSWYYASSSSFF